QKTSFDGFLFSLIQIGVKILHIGRKVNFRMHPKRFVDRFGETQDSRIFKRLVVSPLIKNAHIITDLNKKSIPQEVICADGYWDGTRYVPCVLDRTFTSYAKVKPAGKEGILAHKTQVLFTVAQQLVNCTRFPFVITIRQHLAAMIYSRQNYFFKDQPESFFFHSLGVTPSNPSQNRQTAGFPCEEKIAIIVCRTNMNGFSFFFFFLSLLAFGFPLLPGGGFRAGVNGRVSAGMVR